MPGGVLHLDLARSFSFDISSHNWSDLVPSDRNCTYGIHWIWVLMGQCVMDARGLTAVIFGFICLVAWILNGIPQIIENFRTGLPDKALSPWLLLFWTLGDLTNFAGCILTHQLVLQVVIAVYSIGNDAILISQFIYYKARHRIMLSYISANLGDGAVSPEEYSLACEDDQPNENDTATEVPRVLPVSFLGVLVWLVHVALLTGGQSMTHRLESDHLIPTVWLLLKSSSNPSFLPTLSAKLGYFLGCASSVFYLCSRIPQICRNWQRGSTEGLCLGLFCLAVVGNVSYGLQILLTSSETSYLLRSLPWLIGTLGVLGMDFVIFFQFYYFSREKSQPPAMSTHINRTESFAPLVSAASADPVV